MCEESSFFCSSGAHICTQQRHYHHHNTSLTHHSHTLIHIHQAMATIKHMIQFAEGHTEEENKKNVKRIFKYVGGVVVMVVGDDGCSVVDWFLTPVFIFILFDQRNDDQRRSFSWNLFFCCQTKARVVTIQSKIVIAIKLSFFLFFSLTFLMKCNSFFILCFFLLFIHLLFFILFFIFCIREFEKFVEYFCQFSHNLKAVCYSFILQNKNYLFNPSLSPSRELSRYVLPKLYSMK